MSGESNAPAVGANSCAPPKVRLRAADEDLRRSRRPPGTWDRQTLGYLDQKIASTLTLLVMLAFAGLPVWA